MSFLAKTGLQLRYNPFDITNDVVTLEDQIAGSIDLAVAGLATFLAIVAYRAYKRTRFSQLRYVIFAFSLFTVFLSIKAAQEFLPFGEDSIDLVTSILILLIILSFFFGVLRKKNNSGK